MKRIKFFSILALLALFIACKESFLTDIPSEYYTVTFDKNHPDATGYTEANPRTKTVISPAVTVGSLPTEPTRKGCTFTGWNTIVGGSGTDFLADTPVTADITVYAQWIELEVFEINLNISGDVSGDSVAILPKDGNEGDTITISYTLADPALHNRLVFSGAYVDQVDSAGSGTRTCTIDKNDAISGIITINAVFTHTNKNLDTIAFSSGSVNKIYGDVPFTLIVSNQGSGTGEITFSSSDPDIATVNASSGQVSILKVGVGGCTITAAKAADETYEGTIADCTLIIAKRQLTISGTTVTPTKVFNGDTTAAVTVIGTLTNRVGSDAVTVSASAAYNSPNVNEASQITVIYTISGADADNYIEPVDHKISGSISKAPGAAVAVPTSASKTHNRIIVNAVSAPGNGQVVEYGINTTTSVPSSGWQDGTFFNGLTPNTLYYVFARAKGDANYETGAAQMSAAITTDATPPITQAQIVNFETDALGKTYESAKGGSSPTVAVVTDTVNSGQKSLQITSGGYNQAAIVPINLPYELNGYKSFTFRFNPVNGSFTNKQILVYAAKSTGTFAQHGFGNPADSQYAQFAANLLGQVQASTTTGQWQEFTITITNPGSAISGLKGDIYLAIGINDNSNLTYLLDDITFVIKDSFVPPPAPVTPNPPSVGAVHSGIYRNLFEEWGKTDAQIDAKVQSEWNKKFVNGTTDEMLYVQASDSSMAYIYTADTNDVRSEGMSYGMMMCVQMDDQTRFNKLWKWAHTYMYHDRTVNNTGKNVRGFFAWQCGTDGSKKDTGPAPDGEFYFVTALLFAENRWGNGSGINNYGQYARYIMYDMLHREPGVKDNYGAIPMINATHKIPEFTTVTAQHTDASYMLPAFYDVWAMEIRAGTSYHDSIWGSTSAANADATYWEEVATSCRNYLKNSGVLNATTGLGPDYSSYTGSPGSHGDFEYDAWRIAMNIGFDYSWWAKDTWQKTQSDKIQAFFQSQGVTSYGNRYTLSGNKLGSDHSPGLVACNAVASLAATNERAWEFVENLWDIPVTTGKYRYYDGCLYMMGLLHVSGKFKAYLSTGGGTPNPYISPTSATFNKYTSSSDYKDIPVTMTLNGSTLSSIKNGGTTLTQSNNVYTVNGSTVTIKTAYLVQQSVGTTTLTFTFANGTTRSLSIDIVNTAPTPTITPASATFDKKSGAQADVVVTMTLYTYTLSSIKNGNTTLTQGANVYTVSGSTVTIKAAYLAGLANGNTTLTFTFSDGTTRNIVITIGDTTGGGTIGGGGTEYDFTANPSVAVEYAGSGTLVAQVTGGVLRVEKTNTNHSTPYLIIPFDLGGTTLGSYSKIRFVMKGVSGDLSNKTFKVDVSSNGTTYTAVGTVSTGSFGSSFANYDVSIGSSSLTGPIKIRIYLDNTQGFVYEIQSITFVP